MERRLAATVEKASCSVRRQNEFSCATHITSGDYSYYSIQSLCSIDGESMLCYVSTQQCSNEDGYNTCDLSWSEDITAMCDLNAVLASQSGACSCEELTVPVEAPCYSNKESTCTRLPTCSCKFNSVNDHYGLPLHTGIIQQMMDDMEYGYYNEEVDVSKYIDTYQDSLTKLNVAYNVDDSECRRQVESPLNIVRYRILDTYLVPVIISALVVLALVVGLYHMKRTIGEEEKRKAPDSLEKIRLESGLLE